MTNSLKDHTAFVRELGLAASICARPTRCLHRGRSVLAGAIVMLAVFLVVITSQAAPPTSDGRNYEEVKVHAYTLPDPLLGKDGRRVTDSHTWIVRRRREIMCDFRDLMYGHTPELPITLRAEVVATRKDAVDARRVVVFGHFSTPRILNPVEP